MEFPHVIGFTTPALRTKILCVAPLHNLPYSGSEVSCNHIVPDRSSMAYLFSALHTGGRTG